MTGPLTIEEYLDKPYTIVLKRNSDGTYFAQVAELPGCMTEADAAEEALEMIRDAQRAWLEAALEIGREIPVPEAERQYSGKFNVRIAESLHRDLALLAEREGVSLNQLLVTLLARSVSLASEETTLREVKDRMTEMADQMKEIRDAVVERGRTATRRQGKLAFEMSELAPEETEEYGVPEVEVRRQCH